MTTSARAGPDPAARQVARGSETTPLREGHQQPGTETIVGSSLMCDIGAKGIFRIHTQRSMSALSPPWSGFLFLRRRCVGGGAVHRRLAAASRSLNLMAPRGPPVRQNADLRRIGAACWATGRWMEPAFTLSTTPSACFPMRAVTTRQRTVLVMADLIGVAWVPRRTDVCGGLLIPLETQFDRFSRLDERFQAESVRAGSCCAGPASPASRPARVATEGSEAVRGRTARTAIDLDPVCTRLAKVRPAATRFAAGQRAHAKVNFLFTSACVDAGIRCLSLRTKLVVRVRTGCRIRKDRCAGTASGNACGGARQQAPRRRGDDHLATSSNRTALNRAVLRNAAMPGPVGYCSSRSSMPGTVSKPVMDPPR